MEQIGAGLVAVVVEDDESVRGLIETTLVQAGFEVRSAAFGHEGIALVERHSPDVVTLDVSLPDTNGFEVAKAIRASSDAAIVMVTARAEETATLLGLEAGADDYVTKPFRPRELRARIQAILRRSGRAGTGSSPLTSPSAVTPAPGTPAVATPARPAAAAPPPAPGAGAVQPRARFTPLAPQRVASAAAPLPSTAAVVRHNGLEVDTRRRTATVDGIPVALSRSELDVLLALLAADGRPVSPAGLVTALWAGDRYVHRAPVGPADERAAAQTVATLAAKLGEDPATPRFVEDVPGGYRRTDPR